MHWLLRLLCVNEVLANRPLYDKSHEEFYAPFKADACLPLPDYVEFVSELSKPNSYCDMLAVLAASSVTQKAVQTVWPLPIKPGDLSPFTKLVVGRGVATCCRPVHILWSTADFTAGIPDINHFVPLIERMSEPDTVVECEV